MTYLHLSMTFHPVLGEGVTVLGEGVTYLHLLMTFILYLVRV